ncbi:MAG TPA: hypothetical protein VM925_13940 [Labilithrix sp.]|nr:hypothetical protein [Labilithrix sp.]
MAESDTKSSPPQAKPDVVLLGPPTSDGAGVHVLRAREERLETGELRSLEEGRPITGEVLTLAPRKDNPRICDVKDSYTPSAAAELPMKAKGPAQVATKQYRDNWDQVFAQRSNAELN